MTSLRGTFYNFTESAGFRRIGRGESRTPIREIFESCHLCPHKQQEVTQIYWCSQVFD